MQNERYDDWMPTMIQLRKLFNEYLSRVLDDHRFEGCKIPQAHNSSAAQGNFLETLNMSLNCELSSLITSFLIIIKGTFKRVLVVKHASTQDSSCFSKDNGFGAASYLQ